MVSRTEVDALVFDSGLGGLSITADLRRLLPDLQLAYLADNAGLPYGEKTEHWLLMRVLDVIAAMLDLVEPRVIVIACNTASTVVLPALRARYPQYPIVGVVPAIKPAAALSRSRIIGLLATPGTIRRHYTQTLIEEFAEGCRVIRVGSSELVGAAERKMRGHALDVAELRTICTPFLAEVELDVLVLGCTHFPLIASELQAVLPQVKILDSGPAIAQRVQKLLENLPRASPIAQTAFFTAPESGLTTVLENFGFSAVQMLPLTVTV